MGCKRLPEPPPAQDAQQKQQQMHAPMQAAMQRNVATPPTMATMYLHTHVGKSLLYWLEALIIHIMRTIQEHMCLHLSVISIAIRMHSQVQSILHTLSITGWLTMYHSFQGVCVIMCSSLNCSYTKPPPRPHTHTHASPNHFYLCGSG